MPEQLQTFKASDKQKKPVAAKAQSAKEVETPSVGFPRVEALIDEYQQADEAKEVFADSISRLEGLLSVEKNAKKKADIVRAKRAFEHAMSTLDYLFQVKSELSQQGAATPAPAKGKKK